MYKLTFDWKVLGKKGLSSSNDTSIYNSSQLKNRMTSTVKPVLSGHSKTDKTKVLKTNGRLMKVESIAECSLALIGLENQLLVFY